MDVLRLSIVIASVQFASASISFDPNRHPHYVDESITVSCNSKQNSASIRTCNYDLTNCKFLVNSTTNYASIFIPKLRASDTGFYDCVWFPGNLPEELDSGFITVKLKPGVTQRVQSGDTAILSCKSGIPNATVVWSLNDTVLTNTIDLSPSDGEHRLIVKNVSSSGKYSCMIKYTHHIMEFTKSNIDVIVVSNRPTRVKYVQPFDRNKNIMLFSVNPSLQDPEITKCDDTSCRIIPLSEYTIVNLDTKNTILDRPCTATYYLKYRNGYSRVYDTVRVIQIQSYNYNIMYVVSFISVSSLLGYVPVIGLFYAYVYWWID